MEEEKTIGTTYENIWCLKCSAEKIIMFSDIRLMFSVFDQKNLPQMLGEMLLFLVYMFL